MHINWTTIALIAYGAFSVFVSYLPAPGKAPAPCGWWYEPLFHVLQYLSLNPGRSRGLLRYQNQTSAPDQPNLPKEN